MYIIDFIRQNYNALAEEGENKKQICPCYARIRISKKWLDVGSFCYIHYLVLIHFIYM